MKKRNSLTSTAGALAAAFLLSACGETEQFINNWKVKADSSRVSVSAEFQSQFEINGEISVPFKNYGRVSFGQSENGNFAVNIDLENLGWSDAALRPVSTLPTGARFPSFVDMQIYAVDLADNSDMKLTLYVGNRSASGNVVRKTLLGAGIEIRAIGSTFGNVTITQNYFREVGGAKKQFSAFTIYGPKTNSAGAVEIPGGIFLVADAAQFVTSGQSVMVGQKLEVRGPEAQSYTTEEQRRGLFQRMFRELKRSGVIREKRDPFENMSGG